jgi:hypothetical protein
LSVFGATLVLRWRQTTSSRISAGRHLVPLLDQVDQLVDDRCRRLNVGRVAVQRQHIAAQVEVAVEAPAQRLQHSVLGARQLGGDGIVQGQLPTSQASHAPPR